MPPRKTGAVEGDPEKATPTVAKASNPFDDPEKATATKARASNPLKGPRRSRADDAEPDDEDTNRGMPDEGEDPERENKTAARAPPPKPRNSVRRNSAIEVSQSLQDELQADYQTGQNYQVAEGDESEGDGVSALSLEGDGLEPMDPEMLPRTKQLPLDAEAAEEADREPAADDENATRAGPPIQLEVTAGPDAGQKRRFKGVRMVIGRTPGVDFQLSDQSVSRRHIELVHGGQGTVLRDLGSGNGTKVNGNKVVEKLLEHGDEIAIGKTRIRYVDEMAAFKKAREEAERKEAEEKAAAEAEAQAENAAEAAEGEAADGEGADAGEEGGEAAAGEAEGGDSPDAEAAEQGEAEENEGGGSQAARRPVRTGRGRGEAVPDRKAPPPLRMLLIGGAVLVALVILVGIFTRAPQPKLEDLNRAKAETKLQEARAAVRENRYEDAVAAAEEAEHLSPGIDKSKIGAGARAEIEVQQGLDSLRELLKQNKFEDVRAQLAKLPHGSGRLDDQFKQLDLDISAAEVRYKKDQISSFLAAGEPEAAKRVLETLPVPDQAEPAQKISEFETQLEEMKKQDEVAARRNAAAAAAARKQRREEEMLVAFSVVERKFAGAEWDRAASECNRVVQEYAGDKEIVARAQMLLRTIPNFGRNFDEGIRKYKQGQLAQAAKPLREAYRLYGQMNLRQNPYGGELEQDLAQSALIAGREALYRNDLVTAFYNFRDVVRLDPTEAKGREGLDEVNAKAESLFTDAYTNRALDPRDALRKFKVVVEVTPVGSATHEKAKNQILSMPQ